MKTLLLPAALLCTVASSQAALLVTNGGFGTSNRNGGVVDGGGWFESGTANWVEGSWNSASTTNPDDGDSILLLMDGGSANIGYVYQSLGTVDAADIAAGTLYITADFAEKSDGSTNTAVFDFYVGDFAGAATGTDIDDHLSSQMTITMNAVAQGLTEASGDVSRQNGVSVGTFNLSALNVGDEVWMRIGEVRPGDTTSGDLMIDNVKVTIVPEPSSSALLGLAGLALIFRRRK